VSIRIFDRQVSNMLAPRVAPGGCFNADGADGCSVMNGISSDDVYDLSLSPDGRSVYMAGRSTIASLVRDPATGNLTPGPCHGPAVGCTPVAGFGNASGLVVSPDSRHLYVRGSGRLFVFDRDLTTGALTIKAGAAGCMSEPVVASCTDSVGLGGFGYELSMSADGKFLYAPNQTPGGIAFFQRASDGTLSQLAGPLGGCITANGTSTVAGECATVPDGNDALLNAWAATISPSGKHVFLSGSNGTTVFARSAITGQLTKSDCIAPTTIMGCQQRTGSAGFGVEVSPDDERAAVASYDGSGMGLFTFNDTTGTLTQLAGPLGCLTANGAPGCTAIPGTPNSFGKIAFTPDGLNVYSVASSSLVNVALDVAPVCQPVSAGTAFNTPLKIQLSCSDANGDEMSITAPAQSTHGLLGAVDQATDQVTYSPISGFSGSDSFTYTATAKGVTSAPATVTLAVQQGPDTSVTLTIGTKKLKLNDKHKGKVKLTCPATEESAPCTGKLRVKTRGTVSFQGKKKVVTLATANFSIAAGATKRIRVKFSDKMVELVTKNPDARKLRLVAKVKDTAGNKATVRKKATLRLP
jgi:hypothetical protein